MAAISAVTLEVTLEEIVEEMAAVVVVIR